MKAAKRRPFAERAHEAAVAYAIEVATDPGESDADIAAARNVVARASGLQQRLEIEKYPPHVLRALAEFRRAVREPETGPAPATELPPSTIGVDADHATD